MTTKQVLWCRDHDQDKPGCRGVADARYTMDFTDVEPGGYIYWCAGCGPSAHEMNGIIERAFDTRPGFAEDFKREIDKRRPS